MVEFECPSCGHKNAWNHANMNYRTGHDVELSCDGCSVVILIALELVPEVWDVRLKEGAPGDG